MKREEKNQQSRQKIMDAAIKEFGDKNYAEASLNTICKRGEISKGIIYHYFEDKDELFLACVKECFDALTAHLKKQISMDGDPIEQVLKQYFDTRLAFFDQNPLYLKLFFSAVIMPPPHLMDAISEIRKDFDALNVSVFTSLLQRVPLRSDITIEEVIDEFKLYQDFVNTQYQMRTIRQAQDDMKEHERQCSRSLGILLYGVIAREKEKL